LKTVLKQMQQDSEDNRFEPDVEKVREFGIHEGADEVVDNILRRYINICREMRSSGQGFGPGIQYNFQAFSDEGVEVTLGNYGIMFATLINAAGDPDFKKYLIEKGRKLLGNPQGFFVNSPATNTVVKCKDGYLFIRRGPTAEYKHMLHQLAAGHHDPEKSNAQEMDGQTVVPLEELIAYQILSEPNIPREFLKDFKCNGMALSTGSELQGTEKAEILTQATIDLSSHEIWQSLQSAHHKWETQAMYVAATHNINSVISGTFDSEKDPVLHNVRSYGPTGELGKDKHSVSYWTPVGAAGLLMALGKNFYERALPMKWKDL